jgi:hypothetical protein
LWFRVVAIIIALLVLLGKIVFGSPGTPGSGNSLDVSPSLGS